MLIHPLGRAMSEVVVVTTTLPSDMEESEVISFSEHLVRAKLAACIQHQRISSTYQWRGELMTDQEWRITMKTSQSKRAKLVDEVKAKHPYETPQLIWRSEEASDEYSLWVEKSID